MIKAFTSIVTKCKDIAKKFRNISASANGVEISGRQMVQHWGFVSIPMPGSKALFIQVDNVVYCIASDSDNRPAVEEGECAIYRSKDHYIILKKDGKVAIKASAGVDIDGDLRVTGDVSDKSGTLDRLRQNYNKHTHVGNLGSLTSPTTDAKDI